MKRPDDDYILQAAHLTPDDAARYLGTITTAALRGWIQSGTCPFATAFTKPGSRYATYIVHGPALVRFKRGEVSLAAAK